MYGLVFKILLLQKVCCCLFLSKACSLALTPLTSTSVSGISSFAEREASTPGSERLEAPLVPKKRFLVVVWRPRASAASLAPDQLGSPSHTLGSPELTRGHNMIPWEFQEHLLWLFLGLDSDPDSSVQQAQNSRRHRLRLGSVLRCLPLGMSTPVLPADAHVVKGLRSGGLRAHPHHRESLHSKSPLLVSASTRS